jgi:hypothetical protein
LSSFTVIVGMVIRAYYHLSERIPVIGPFTQEKPFWHCQPEGPRAEWPDAQRRPPVIRESPSDDNTGQGLRRTAAANSALSRCGPHGRYRSIHSTNDPALSVTTITRRTRSF